MEEEDVTGRMWASSVPMCVTGGGKGAARTESMFVLRIWAVGRAGALGPTKRERSAWSTLHEAVVMGM